MTNKPQSKFNLIVALAVVVLAVVQVVILNFNSTSGEQLRSLTLKILETESQNNILLQEIASASAIATISVRAKEIGFIQNKNVLSLSSSKPLALSQNPSL